MKTKICSKCKKDLKTNQFIKDNNRKDRLYPYCKNCLKKYYLKNKKEILNRNKKWRLTNLLKIKKYLLKNQDKIKKQKQMWHRLNRQKTNKIRKIKLKNNINYKISEYLRSRIWHSLRGNPKLETTLRLIGCSIEKLKNHLEKQFTKGMSWLNYGKWHIDHIIPCISFDLSKLSEQKKCFHYTNLQPLWAKENLSKNDKILRKVKD